MKKYQDKAQILIGAALVLIAAQPVQAASTQVTGVQIEQNGNGIELKLKTASTQRELPQIFTINQGNALVADLLDTQLQLPSGESFRQDNPHPEIEAIEVSQFDANSIRVVIRGKTTVPALEIQPPGGDRIAFSLAPGQNVTANSAQTPVVPVEDATVTQRPIPVAPPTVAPAPNVQPTQPQRTPEVLIPNPQITIEGNPAPAAGVVEPVSPAPPFLPRAIAPPVGDIAVSNIDTTPELIDLGTAAIVPRVVLREAPVREVLALLARSAGVNLIFSGQGAEAQGGQQGQQGEGQGETTISLDLENEPVQEVFNYVLQISGLQANRRGQSIFVGTRLPQSARDIVTRTLRLNQVEAPRASSFLATFGAATQQVFVPTELITDPETQRIIREVEGRPEIISVTVNEGEGTAAPLLLTDLSVSIDERLNSITLVGAPRKIQIATSLLTQLDARRRQVAVNVKIVDVNLLNTDRLNSSFSFGVGDGFFVVDNGAAAFNYGGFNPPTAAQTTNSTIIPTVIQNPLSDAAVFFDPNQTVGVPGTLPGTVLIDPDGNITRLEDRGEGLFPNPFVDLGDALQAGFTNITPATDTIITQTRDPGEDGILGTADDFITSSVSRGQEGEVEVGLQSLFQFPSKFLASLEAEITNGNAKILTDPTLVVQEGQIASVNLTQEVFGGIEETVEDGLVIARPIIKDAGLIVTIAINQIDDNGFVSLNVNPTVSAPSATISTGTGQGSITLLQERNLTSGEIRVRDGQTLILSGIIQETDQTTVSKVPILGDIPILGALFRSTNRTNQRNEVIVLLTPQIIDDSERNPFGYNYSPSRDVREVLQQQNFPVQGNPQMR